MGTIVTRRRKDGTTGYTARIRLKRDGRLVHSETETLSRKALAQEWLTRREAELQGQRARGEPAGQRMTIAEMVRYASGKTTPDPRVFPFDAKSVGAAFTRAVHFLGIEDLHFHDLRHEATSRLFELG